MPPKTFFRQGVDFFKNVVYNNKTMKKFTYPILEISVSREDVKMDLDREYKIYPKVNMNDYQLLSFGHSMIELKSEIFHYH